MTPLEAAFLSALPRGEWANATIVAVHGMMSRRSIQADAEWLRDGGVSARLKCILVADAHAGPDSKAVVGRPRLERVCDRLKTAMTLNPPSLVRLLSVDFMKGFDGLLIAMERVSPLATLFSSGPLGPHAAAQMIRSLSSSATPWIHFDICPSNTGRTDAGRFVFIDPESFYPIEASQVIITYPAMKRRLPATIDSMVRSGLQSDGTLPDDVATFKHDSELLILAAECCLGPMEETPLTESYVERWTGAPSNFATAGAVLKPQLLALCSGGKPDLAHLVVELEALGATRKAAPPGPRAAEVSFNLHDLQPTTWDDLEPARRALRAERLQGPRLATYRDAVLNLARSHPPDRRLWQEAVLIVVGYQKDPDLALEVIDDALKAFPHDPEFLADRRLVVMCRGTS